MPTVVFATSPSPLPVTSGTASLSLLSVTYGEVSGGNRQVNVRGVNGGATQLQVDLSTDAASASQTFTVPPATSIFDVSLQIQSSITDDALTLRVSQVGTQAPLSVQAILSLFQERVDLTVGEFLGVHTQYLAGTADRLVRSLTFVKLEQHLGKLDFLGRLIQANTDGTFKAIDQSGLERAVGQAMAQSETDLNDGRISVRDYYRRLGEALRTDLPNHLIDPPRAILAALDGSSSTSIQIPAPNAQPTQTPTSGATTTTPPIPSRPTMMTPARIAPNVLGTGVIVPGLGRIVSIAGGKLQDAIDGILRNMSAYQRLGVLFHERTRFRPAGLVVGEPFYQLALVPGEEVQLRQTTETRKQISLTDIQDREQEQQTTLSSTLSTDMSSTIGAQTNFQTSTTLGGGIDGNIPDVPIGISSNAASTVSNADADSQQSTLTDRVERTSQASAKLRSEHKIQLEITTEESNTLASTRTLRNPNSLRTVHHTFYKMYRREQATLERHDAQLSFLLTVTDASREPRMSFEAGLNRMDPNNEDLYNVVAPSTSSVDKDGNRIDAPNQDGGVFHGLIYDRWVPFSGDLHEIAGMGTSFCLAAPPKFTMIECHIFYGGDTLHSTDGSDSGDSVSENELVDLLPGVQAAGRFLRAGGALKWHTQPKAGAQDARFNLQVNMPVVYTGPTQLFGEVESSISFVKFHIETEWRTSDQALLDYRKDCRSEQLRLINEFSVDAVVNLRATAASDYAPSLIDRALSENLQLPDGFPPERLRDIFDFDYVSITSHPYWTTDHGREEHARLLARLLQMPVALPLEQILTDELTASGATVYLPIRHGNEEEALALLPEAAASATRVAADFTAFRDSKYGLTETGRHQYDPPLGPTPPNFTPAGQNTWETVWEAPQRGFDILGQWAELVPTDGVHIESHLSSSVAIDERARAKLSRLDDIAAV